MVLVSKCSGKMTWMGVWMLTAIGVLLGLGGVACDEPEPTPIPRPTKPPMPGVTFIRGGVVIEDFKATLEPWVEEAPSPGSPQALGFDADGPIFVPVAWFPGQRFVIRVGEHGYAAAAPIRPWIYPLLDRRIPVPEGMSLSSDATGVQVAISPGGERVALSDFEGALELLPLPGGRPIATRAGDGQPFDGLHIARDGSALIARRGGALQAYSGQDLSPLWSLDLPGDGPLDLKTLSQPPGGLAYLAQEGGGTRLYVIDGAGAIQHRFPKSAPLAGQGTLALDEAGTRALVGVSDALLWVDFVKGRAGRVQVKAPIAGVALSPGGEAGTVALKGGGLLSFDWIQSTLTETAPLGIEDPILEMSLTHKGLFVLTEGADGGALIAFNNDGTRQFRHRLGSGGGLWGSPDGRYLAIPIIEKASAPKGAGLSVYDREVRIGGLSGPTLHERFQRDLGRSISASRDGLFLGVRALPREEGDSLMLRVYR